MYLLALNWNKFPRNLKPPSSAVSGVLNPFKMAERCPKVSCWYSSVAHVSKNELSEAYWYRSNVKHMCLKGSMIVYIVLTKIIMWKRAIPLILTLRITLCNLQQANDKLSKWLMKKKRIHWKICSWHFFSTHFNACDKFVCLFH